MTLAAALPACKDDAKSDSPPPPPPPSSAPSAHADVCAGGGAEDTDAISAPFVTVPEAPACHMLFNVLGVFR